MLLPSRTATQSGTFTTTPTTWQASVAELIYREPLRIPGEFLAASPTTRDPSELITQLRRHFEHLLPFPAARQASPTVFVHKDLEDSTHIFLRQDAVRRPLYPPYSGLHRILARTNKTLRIAIDGRPVTVLTDRVKPAYTMVDPDGRTMNARAPTEQTSQTLPQPYKAEPSSHADQPFRPPRPLSSAVQRANILLGKGVIWEHPTGILTALFGSQANILQV
jgi:hypothetical protein